MLVHVIKESGTRFEASFPDKTPDAVVLGQLAAAKATFGRVRQVKRDDAGLPVMWDDPTAPFSFDDPTTAVVVGKIGDGGEFAEIRRIKGPPAPPPEPAEGEPAVPTP